MHYIPRHIIIENRVADTPAVQRVLSRCPGAVVEFRDTIEEDPSAGETTLFLLRNPGFYFKPCPETPEYVCCNYRILNFASGCPIQCTYCILNGYFRTRSLSFFCDHDRMFAELSASLSSAREFLRIGSGEFTDSLVLDPLTDFSLETIPYFLKQKNALYEIKTKTANIRNLLDFEPGRRVLVSWSVNPPQIQSAEEKGSASLKDRIAAAEACMKQGYLIGFHFDPIIRHSGWAANYGRVIDLIYSRIDPEAIAWISLGCLRFVPELKNVIRERYPETPILYEEFVQGRDGKMRYFRPLREEMYSELIGRIRKHHPEAPVYFCMETPLTWERVMGIPGQTTAGLRDRLDGTQKRFVL